MTEGQGEIERGNAKWRKGESFRSTSLCLHSSPLEHRITKGQGRSEDSAPSF